MQSNSTDTGGQPTGTASGADAAGNATGGGAGPLAKPGGAPDLPDVVPEGVQSLLDGIFSAGGDAVQALGNLVSDLAGAIGGDGSAVVVAGHLADVWTVMGP